MSTRLSRVERAALALVPVLAIVLGMTLRWRNADAQIGFNLTCTDGTTSMTNCRTWKATSGCALTINGTEADFACTGTGVSGSGITNTVPKFTSSTAIGNSAITDNGTSITSTELFTANISGTGGGLDVGGISMTAATAATAGVPQQISPSLRIQGNAWNTTTVSSQTEEWNIIAYTFTGASTDADLIFFKTVNGGAQAQQLRLSTDGTGGTSLIGSSASTYYPVMGPTYFNLDFNGSVEWVFNGTAMYPNQNQTLGKSGTNIPAIYSTAYYGLTQTVADAASISINPALGEDVRITLGATAITSVTISTGVQGQRLNVEVIQDGTGNRTIQGTNWTNVLFAGGSYTATSALNKRDAISFVYDATDSKWVETSRSLNM